MVDRIKFKHGEQRKFLNLVVERLGCMSVRGILQFGVEVSYDSLKSYYIERRLIPIDLFDNLCYLSKINKKDLDYFIVDGNWGQIKGGKTGKIEKKSKNER